MKISSNSATYPSYENLTNICYFYFILIYLYFDICILMHLYFNRYKLLKVDFYIKYLYFNKHKNLSKHILIFCLCYILICFSKYLR